MCKKQTHITSICHWDVVDNFKDFLLFRQAEVEGYNPKMNSRGFIPLKKSHLPGKVHDLEGAIDTFVNTHGDGSIIEGLEKKIFVNDGPQSDDDWTFVTQKIDAKWLPIKESIVRGYVKSEEFDLWLENEAMRKAGPREPTEEELKEQAEMDAKREGIRGAFEQFYDKGKDSNGASADDERRESFEHKRNGLSDENRNAILKIVKTWYRQLCQVHHPDHDGDPEQMIQVNQAFETLKKLLN